MKRHIPHFRHPPPGRQQGSTATLAVLWITVALICLMSIDIGNIFWQRREAQRVADMAALAGAQRVLDSCATAQQAARESVLLNARTATEAFAITGAPVCGVWSQTPNGAGERFTATAVNSNAVRVTVSRTAPYWFVFNTDNPSRTISASATAKMNTPLAALSVRSTLLTVDTSRSQLLNAAVGGLLGGNLALDAVGWQGLVNSDINLLSYLDRLALKLGVAAGDYSALLTTRATLSDFLQVAADVLGGGSAAYTAIIGIQNAIGVLITPLQLTLSDVLQLQTGTPAAALDTNIQAFQLVQGLVQLANSKSAVAANVSLLNIPAIGNITAKLKIIEPPQLSAIGNPIAAATDLPAYNGPNRIYVRTAQLRSLIAVDLPLLSTISGLLNAVTSLLAPVTSLLNNVLSLNLVSILCLVNCTGTQVVLIPENPVHLDINLDIAPSEARVTGFNCQAAATKSLDVTAATAVAKLRIGQMTASQEAAIFSSTATPVVTPIPLLDVETRSCTLLLLCGSWTKYSRTGLLVDSPVLASSPTPHTYSPVPRLDQAPAIFSFSMTNIVNSLSSTSSGLQLQTYKYNPAAVNRFGDILGSATQLVNAASSAAQSVISSLLSPMLDPLVNFLLNALGINLAQADIGAQLTCGADAELVY